MKKDTSIAEFYRAFKDAEKDSALKSEMRSFRDLMAYYKCAIMEIETKFNVLNEEFSLEYGRNPISVIKSRLKKPESIRNKLERMGKELTISNAESFLDDIAGVRVVCSFPSDVYMLAEAFLKQDDIKLIAKKDYIANPKPNGYRSMHLIISVPIYLTNEKKNMRVEIQLRTIAMDFWASLEHQLCYKKDFELTEEIKRELYCCAEFSAQLDERMDALRGIISEGYVNSD